MLLELSVARIALIESLQLRFGQGLQVFTGETGAGKSIILDAIGLLLGNRWSSDMLRTGAEDAYVEALFSKPRSNADIPMLLTSWGYEPTTDEILISRQMYRNGRTVCRINGRIVTVQMLRELGIRLVQQHGQHDGQGLLRPEEQLRLLDVYGRHTDILTQVETAYRAWMEAKKAWQDAQLDEQERVRRLDMLAFQIDEIDTGALTVGEDETLRGERQRLQFADKISQSLQNAVQALEGDFDGTGLTGLMATAISELAVAFHHDDTLKEVSTLLDNADVYVQEALRGIKHYLQGVDANPERLSELDNRLVEIRTLTRKYGPTVEEVLHHGEKAKRERAALQHHEEQLNQLEDALRKREQTLKSLSENLHEQRVRAAGTLAAEVQAVLRQLNMPSAVLTIDVPLKHVATLADSYGPTGFDTVQFLFSANKGELPKPLQKIASGGELSRTLLALKAVLAKMDELETLIFDEIDTGVSGATAAKIAEQLLLLGLHRQVICVTHSAQIAAAGHEQYKIEKMEQEQQTSTSVTCLDERGRVREVARLVGSGGSDETAHQHAKALLESFRTAMNTVG